MIRSCERQVWAAGLCQRPLVRSSIQSLITACLFTRPVTRNSFLPLSVLHLHHQPLLPLCITPSVRWRVWHTHTHIHTHTHTHTHTKTTQHTQCSPSGSINSVGWPTSLDPRERERESWGYCEGNIDQLRRLLCNRGVEDPPERVCNKNEEEH